MYQKLKADNSLIIKPNCMAHIIHNCAKNAGDRLDIPSLVRGIAAGWGLVLMVGDVGLFGRLVDIVMDWGLVVVVVRRLVPRALIPVLRVRWAVHRG